MMDSLFKSRAGGRAGGFEELRRRSDRSDTVECPSGYTVTRQAIASGSSALQKSVDARAVRHHRSVGK